MMSEPLTIETKKGPLACTLRMGALPPAVSFSTLKKQSEKWDAGFDYNILVRSWKAS